MGAYYESMSPSDINDNNLIESRLKHGKRIIFTPLTKAWYTGFGLSLLGYNVFGSTLHIRPKEWYFDIPVLLGVEILGGFVGMGSYKFYKKYKK